MGSGGSPIHRRDFFVDECGEIDDRGGKIYFADDESEVPRKTDRNGKAGIQEGDRKGGVVKGAVCIINNGERRASCVRRRCVRRSHFQRKVMINVHKEGMSRR